MNKLTKNALPLSLMLTLPAMSFLYTLLNNANSSVRNLTLGIDKLIPFVSVFIIPYIFWNIFNYIVLAYLCFKDKQAYFNTLLALNAGSIICYIIYSFFQTTVPRSELIGNDIFTWLVGIVYTADNPYNCFPSIHVLYCYLMMKGIKTSRVANKLNISLVYATSILIIFSTLFVKQHVVLDALAAIILGELVFTVASKFTLPEFFFQRKSSTFDETIM